MSKRAREFDPEEAVALLRQLRRESGGDFDRAATVLKTVVQNVLEHPSEERYRTIRLGNPTFCDRLGRFEAGMTLLRQFGFQDAESATGAQTEAQGVTHLALPVASPELLAQGLVLVEAALQAAVLIDHEAGNATHRDDSISSTASSATASALSSASRTSALLVFS